MCAEETAVGLFQLTVPVENCILGQEVQRRCVYQKHRQFKLMDQPQKLLQQMLDEKKNGESETKYDISEIKYSVALLTLMLAKKMVSFLASEGRSEVNMVMKLTAHFIQ